MRAPVRAYVHSYSLVVTIPCGLCHVAWQIPQMHTRTHRRQTPLQRWHKRPLASLLIAVKGTPVHVCMKTVHLGASSLTRPRFLIHQARLSSHSSLQRISICFTPLAGYVFALRGLHPCSLFLILSNFSFSSPLVLHSLSLSSVTLPLFSARCDQLGDISPADIPGDRALRRPRSPSSLPLLPPFSFFSPHLVVLSLLLLISSTFLSSTNNLTRAPPSTNLTPYSADSDISALLSSVSPLIYPSFFFPLYVPLCPLCTNSIPPRSFFFFFSHPSLSRSLQVAIHNDGPVFSPVCQPLTCILATTSPLAQVLHAEQANKTPGEWRTSTLVYPPPSIRSVIPSHIKRRPYSAGVWRGKKKNAFCPPLQINSLELTQT